MVNAVRRNHGGHGDDGLKHEDNLNGKQCQAVLTE